MKHHFPSHKTGHAIAVLGAMIVHGGVMAWAMAPQAPAVLPQQQVIQVTMVAPTVVQQKEVVQPAPQVKETPKVPPKETGMIKAEPKQEAIRKPENKNDTPQEQKQVQQAQTRLTSGLQSSQATEKNAAIMEPVAASYLNNPSPEYPSRARSRRQEGTVMLEVRVTPDGKPGAIEISRSSGHNVLDMAALDAVKQWRFIPARRGSQLVEASVVVPVEFRIN